MAKEKEFLLVEKYWCRIHDLSDRAVHLIAERMDSTSFTLEFASRIFFHSCLSCEHNCNHVIIYVFKCMKFLIVKRS